MERAVIIIKNDMFISGKKVILEWEDGHQAVYNNTDPAVVLALVKRYNVKDIYVTGNKIFNSKYVNKIL